ncbi:thioredoxin-like [Gouania willdenowi]|uniref:thioredoxin-like n=1 Tax=Gouania willdenowi TaxID=441366 RepID=UPI0010554209|nr:thioredoxin-like [Gouania willdenowi]
MYLPVSAHSQTCLRASLKRRESLSTMPCTQPHCWKDFGDIIRNNLTKLVVVFFGCKSCEQSKQLDPVIDELAGQFPNVVFAKVDKDEATDVAGYCNVSSTPVIHFYNKGKKEKDLIAPTGEELKKRVQELI